MTQAGLKIPAPWKHDAAALPFSSEGASSKDNAGFWKDIWEKDGQLFGMLSVPREEDASRVGTSVVEVSPLVQNWKDGKGRSWDDSITHIALVTHPVVPGQDNFEPIDSTSMALSISTLKMADEVATKPTAAPTPDEQKVVEPVTSEPTDKATGSSLKDAVLALRQVGIDLPDDTDPANFIERLLTATRQKVMDKTEQANEGSTTMAPDNSREEPAPVAMAIGDHPQGKGLLAFAQTTLTKTYLDRIHSLVRSGRCNPTVAKDKLEPMLNGFQLSLSAEGIPKETPLDTILTTLEAQPAASGLSGLPVSDEVVLSIGSEQDLPAELIGQTEPDDRRAAEVANMQLEAAGRTERVSVPS